MQSLTRACFQPTAGYKQSNKAGNFFQSAHGRTRIAPPEQIADGKMMDQCGLRQSCKEESSGRIIEMIGNASHLLLTCRTGGGRGGRGKEKVEEREGVWLFGLTDMENAGGKAKG
jgi:hypothetical protein